MESWQTAILVLLAVLTGSTLPVLVQAVSAVRSARAVLARADRIAARLEEGQRVERFLDAVAALSETANRLRDATKVAAALGAALGPAVGAAVKAWRAPRGEETGDAPGDGQDPAQASSRKQTEGREEVP